MRAGPGFLAAATSVIAIGTHSLCVVLSVSMRTLGDLAFAYLIVWARNFGNGSGSFLISSII